MKPFGRGVVATTGMLALAGLGFFGPIEQLSWTEAGLLGAGLTAAIIGLIEYAVGYRAVTDRRVHELRQRSVWHLASSPRELNDGRLHLELSKCRRRSMVLRRDRWWLLPERAVYLFADEPTGLDRQWNLTRDRAAYRYKLDGADLPLSLLFRDNEIAVTADLNLRVTSMEPTTHGA